MAITVEQFEIEIKAILATTEAGLTVEVITNKMIERGNVDRNEVDQDIVLDVLFLMDGAGDNDDGRWAINV